MVKQIKRLQLGKKGLTEEFIGQIKSILTKEKMIKINVLKSACRDKKELEEKAKKIVEQLGPYYDYKSVGYVLTIMKFRKKVRQK